MSTFDRSVLRDPRWIAAIVVAIGLAALFVRLGIWQLDRLDERRAANARIEERSDAAPRPLADLVAEYGDAPGELLDRPVVVEGEYRPELEFVSVGRTYGADRGTLVLTPLELDDGRLIIVVRGLVPPDEAGPPTASHRPPTGRVTLIGRIDDGEEPLRIGEPDPTDGILTSLSRVDLEYVDRWVDGDVLDVSLVLETSDPPPPDGTPVRIPEEELSEGSHLGYAIQWFAFAVIALVGIVFLVRRAGTRADGDVSGSGPGTAPLP